MQSHFRIRQKQKKMETHPVQPEIFVATSEKIHATLSLLPALHKLGPEVFRKTQLGITQFGVCKWCFGKPLADYFLHRDTLTQYAEQDERVAAAQHWSSDSW